MGEFHKWPSGYLAPNGDFYEAPYYGGNEYSFSFSWSDMQETIYSDGPEAAANYYFNEIKEGIESGSASTDTPTL